MQMLQDDCIKIHNQLRSAEHVMYCNVTLTFCSRSHLLLLSDHHHHHHHSCSQYFSSCTFLIIQPIVTRDFCSPPDFYPSTLLSRLCFTPFDRKIYKLVVGLLRMSISKERFIFESGKTVCHYASCSLHCYIIFIIIG